MLFRSEVVREESIGHAVDAEVEVIGVGSGGDGVSAGLLFSFGIRGYGRDELAGDEREGMQFIENEIEVVTLGRFRDQRLACQTCRIEFTRQGGFSLANGNEAWQL